jgi:hypothetical protein
MIEKNFDPDNENCPEKETVEALYNLKCNASCSNADYSECGQSSCNELLHTLSLNELDIKTK